GFIASEHGGTDCDDLNPTAHNDLDCDGWPDLFISSYRGPSSGYEQDSWVYWGSDRFDPISRLALPTTGAAHSAAGDLNGDGFVDLVVPSKDEYDENQDQTPGTQVTIFWGSEHGPVAADTSSLEAHGPESVAIEDLDGDSHPDLLVLCAADGTEETASRIYWGPLNPNLESNPADSTLLQTGIAHSFAIADFDGDEDLDIAISSYGDASDPDSVAIHINQEAGRSWASVELEATPNPRGLDAGDLNNDGHIDLVVANYTRELYSHVYWGPVLGSTTTELMPLETEVAMDVAIEDLNQDGVPDLVFANYKENEAACNSSSDCEDVVVTDSFTYWGKINESGDVTFETRTDFQTHGANAITTGDINLDGHPDVLVASHTSTADLDENGSPDNSKTSSLVFYGPLGPEESWVLAETLRANAAWNVVLIGGGP
ncbi:MAG: VCBS repeat-containing protein, partial [Myxococcota bacterium]|nr:VCBS repeat-containing protein [Myxococcota bacterium]